MHLIRHFLHKLTHTPKTRFGLVFMCCTVWVVGVLTTAYFFDLQERGYFDYMNKTLEGAELDAFSEQWQGLPGSFLIIVGTLPVGFIFILVLSSILSIWYCNRDQPIFFLGRRTGRNVLSMLIPAATIILLIAGIIETFLGIHWQWFDFYDIIFGVIFALTIFFIAMLLRAAVSKHRNHF